MVQSGCFIPIHHLSDLFINIKNHSLSIIHWCGCFNCLQHCNKHSCCFYSLRTHYNTQVMARTFNLNPLWSIICYPQQHYILADDRCAMKKRHHYVMKGHHHCCFNHGNECYLANECHILINKENVSWKRNFWERINEELWKKLPERFKGLKIQHT